MSLFVLGFHCESTRTYKSQCQQTHRFQWNTRNRDEIKEIDYQHMPCKREPRKLHVWSWQILWKADRLWSLYRERERDREPAETKSAPFNFDSQNICLNSTQFVAMIVSERERETEERKEKETRVLKDA